MILLENKTNVAAPNGTYPYGQVKDNTGSNDGTPLNKATLEDYIQFFHKMFAESGLTSNGLPDNVTNTWQLYLAFEKLTGAGAWVDAGNPTTTTSGVTIGTGGGNIRYNKYRIAGKTLYWQMSVAAVTIVGSITEIVIPLPAAINTLAFDHNLGIQVGWYTENNEPLFVQMKSATSPDSVTLSRLAFEDFVTANGFSFSLVIPLQ